MKTEHSRRVRLLLIISAAACATACGASGGGEAATGGGAPPTAAILNGKLLSEFQYPYGIKSAAPAGETREQTDAYLISQYEDWKKAYVVDAGNGMLRVQRDPASDYDTVSEGQAYGLLFAVYFDDRATFDGLLKYVNAYCDPKSTTRYKGLMHWIMDRAGVEINEFGIPRSSFAGKVAWIEFTREKDQGGNYTGQLYLEDPDKPVYKLGTTNVGPAPSGDHVYLQASYSSRADRSSATDADVDIIAALIMASNRWGRSTTTYDVEARYFLQAVLAEEVEVVWNDQAHDPQNATYWLRAGNLWGGQRATNPCYFTPAWWRLFRNFILDQGTLWKTPIKANNWSADRRTTDTAPALTIVDGVLSNMYAQMERLDAVNGTAGLFPDWVDLSEASPKPVKGVSDRRYYFNSPVGSGQRAYLDWSLDKNKDGTIEFATREAPGEVIDAQSYNFYYDAVRVPWRIGMDYLLFGEPRAKKLVAESARFFKNLREAQASIDPSKSGIVDGFSIDGGPWDPALKDGFNMAWGGQHESVTFTTMTATASMVLDDAADGLANARAFYELVKNTQEDMRAAHHYYGSATRLLSLLYMSGRMTNLADLSNPILPRAPAQPATVGPVTIDLAYADYAAYGSEKLKLNDRSRYFNIDRTAWADVGAGLKGNAFTDGNTYNAETGQSTYVSNVICGLPLYRNRVSWVDAWAIATGAIEAQSGTEGHLVPYYQGDPGLMDLAVNSAGFAPGTGKVDVYGSSTLPPGSYGDVTVYGSSKLSLQGGVYQLASLTAFASDERIGPTEISFDTSSKPVLLLVKGDINIHSRTHFLRSPGVGADARKILIVSDTTNSVYVAPQVNWRGTLIALRASLVNVDLGNPSLPRFPVGGGDPAKLEAGGVAYGAIWGRSVEIHQDSNVLFARLDWAAFAGLGATPPPTPPPGSYALTVSTVGTGGGTVTSSPAGIGCPSTCSASYPSGTTVTLTATANGGSTFSGWSGACSGTGTCVVTMSAAQAVTATFAQSGAGTPCANPRTFDKKVERFGTTGAVCYRTSRKVNGWTCWEDKGRTVSVNGVQTVCGGLAPVTPWYDGYTYFSYSAGQNDWTGMEVW